MKFHCFINLTALVAAMSFATISLSSDLDINLLQRQPDGLHKAALASGGTYRTGGGSPPKSRVSDLNQLVTGSPTVVVATVTNATAALKDDGRFLFTNYHIADNRNFNRHLLSRHRWSIQMDRDLKRELSRGRTLAVIVIVHGLIIFALMTHMTTVPSRNFYRVQNLPR